MLYLWFYLFSVFSLLIISFDNAKVDLSVTIRNLFCQKVNLLWYLFHTQ